MEQAVDRRRELADYLRREFSDEKHIKAAKAVERCLQDNETCEWCETWAVIYLDDEDPPLHDHGQIVV